MSASTSRRERSERVTPPSPVPRGLRRVDEGRGCAVRVRYLRDEQGYHVRVHDGDARLLCAALADDRAAALRAAAAVLGLCDELGYRIEAIEPFPWALAG